MTIIRHNGSTKYLIWERNTHSARLELNLRSVEWKLTSVTAMLATRSSHLGSWRWNSRGFVSLSTNFRCCAAVNAFCCTVDFRRTTAGINNAISTQQFSEISFDHLRVCADNHNILPGRNTDPQISQYMYLTFILLARDARKKHCSHKFTDFCVLCVYCCNVLLLFIL